VINSFSPLLRSSFASSGPPRAPTAYKASFTRCVEGAKAGRSGKSRPKVVGLVATVLSAPPERAAQGAADAAGDGGGNRARADARTLQGAAPAIARAAVRFVDDCHRWKGCSDFAALPPRTTPAMVNKR
jgi:hypothetical protein